MSTHGRGVCVHTGVGRQKIPPIFLPGVRGLCKIIKKIKKIRGTPFLAGLKKFSQKKFPRYLRTRDIILLLRKIIFSPQKYFSVAQVRDLTICVRRASLIPHLDGTACLTRQLDGATGAT